MTTGTTPKRAKKSSGGANLFISWSGPRSLAVARALHSWLPTLIDAARPWMSDESLRSGKAWFPEIMKQLETIEVAVVCLTPDNLEAPWLIFESGAVAGKLSDTKRVVPYYLGLKPSDVTGPLSHYQGRQAEREATWELVKDINEATGATVDVNILQKKFEKFWSELEEAIAKAPASQEPATAHRSVEDMVREILDLSRAIRSDVSPPAGFPLPSFYDSANFLGAPFTGVTSVDGDVYRIVPSPVPAPATASSLAEAYRKLAAGAETPPKSPPKYKGK